MSSDTLTVKFRGKGPQDAWLTRLQALCRRLVETGIVKAATPTVLFPGHRNPVMAGMFTVEVEDAPADVTTLFEPLEDVEFVAHAAHRGMLSET
jgi:hypothetical protein